MTLLWGVPHHRALGSIVRVTLSPFRFLEACGATVDAPSTGFEPVVGP